MTDPVIVAAPGPVILKVVALMVVVSIPSLNVAATVVLSATPAAPFAGMVETTVGCGAVIKVHAKLAARGAPEGFFAPVVIVASYKVLLARTSVGVNVALVPA